MGGVAGHIKHFYEDPSLTFKEMIGIIGQLLNPNTSEVKLSLKIDGINIFFTKIGDQIAVARNKRQLKKPLIGEDAIRKQFEHVSHVADAFVWAIKQLAENVEDVFENGRYWINAELVYRHAGNFVTYTEDMIVFHTLVEVDENGNIIGTERITDINRYVKNVNKKARKLFRVSYLKDIDFSEAKKDFEAIVNYIKKLSGGRLQITVRDWLYERLLEEKQITSEFEPDEILDLIDRFFKNSSLTQAQKLVRYRNRDLSLVELSIRRLLNKLLKIEQLVLYAIADQLADIASAMSSSKPKDVKEIKQLLQKAQHWLRSSNLSGIQLDRMRQVISLLSQEISDELNSAQPWAYAEGLVIEDSKGNVWKITGIFQYLNRINFALKTAI